MDVIKIPVDVQCLLSASARINNYKSAVEELVYNSLDAESSCIAIRIYVQNNWLQVVDNGWGIKKADYKLLGERYATSKLTNANALKAAPYKYGYQGQALANIIEVSESVKITSRSENAEETWAKTFTKGNIEPECFKVPLRPSKGTTVEINGFLFNLNIQKKYINAFNELQDIKTFLHQLSLVFNNVSISLRDDSENKIIFKMHKCKDHYQTLQSVFDIDIKNIQELQVEKNEYKVKAYIGTKKTDIKNYHWIYLNNKFVQNSNLHRYINNKFSKPKHIEVRKVKNKRANYEDSSTHSVFVPFYFLFITCPYYDYDIVNSLNKTNVEFKHWGSINNILEKLIKFYEREINFINSQTTKTKLQETSSKVENTRVEVKKIMDRILGKPTKLSRVCEMHNGVKGRHAKRKKKKQTLDNSFANLQIPDNHGMPQKSLESVKQKLSINKFNKHTTSKIYDMNIKSIELNKTINPKENASKRNLKVFKKATKCKCNENVQNIIKILKNNTYSTKKRRNKLSCAINDLLNFKDCKKNIENNPLSKIPNKNPDIQMGRDVVWDEDEKISINKKSSDIAQRPIDINTSIKVRSYDLLQTILKTQQDFEDQNSGKEQTYISFKKKIQRKTITNCFYFSPGLTFQSHKYDIASEHEKDIQTKTGKITKRYSVCNAKSKRKRNIAQSNIILKETQVSEDDIVQFSKQLRNQVMKDMKFIFDDKKYHKTQSHKLQNDCTDKLNVGVNVNIESTYTILVDSIYNSLLAHNTNKSLIDQAVSYSKISCQDKIHGQASKKTLPDEIMLSEFQYTHALNDNDSIKPLDVCEVIINSSVEVVKENNEESTSSQFVNKNNIANYGMNGSNNNMLHQEDSAKSIHIQENEQKNTERNDGIDLNNKSQDNFIYNFELNTRQRLLPKGMSQIFDNCFSKNICSYNLETEYYENIIYNNFVKNVAINSEIFEPTVHNMKEFIKGDNNKQKIIKKLTKHNADLIFGADSLRCAKILGQVDCKFIAAKIQHTQSTPEFLVMFDQHAVHERIRLENNLSYYFNGDSWRKATIDTISLKLSEDEILYLHNHKNKFTRFGLEWTVTDNSEILLHSIPKAIIGKNPRPAETIVKNVKNLILEQIHAIKNQKGNVSLYPQSIMNLVFSEACRYAIKFGDNLLLRDCVELIAALANCKTPFQCAHGRPVMAVIMELRNEHIDYKVNMKNIIQFKNRIGL